MDFIHLHPSELGMSLHLKDEVLQLLLLNHHLCFFFPPPRPSSFTFARSMLKCIHTGQGISSCSLASQQVVHLTNSKAHRGMGREHGPVARNAALLSRYPVTLISPLLLLNRKSRPKTLKKLVPHHQNKQGTS